MPENTEKTLTAACSLLASARHVCVMSHHNPDGDALGSILGLTLALQAAGITATAALADDIAARFDTLPGRGSIVASVPPSADVLVAVDAADLARLGKLGAGISQVHLNIDHHLSNTRFGKLNLIDTRSAATAQYLAELLPVLKLELTTEVATCLLAGIVTDTLGFRTANTTPATLTVSQKLIAAGAPLADVYDRTLHRRSLAALRLWGDSIQQIEQRDGLVHTSVTLASKAAHGYGGSGDGDVVTLLTALENVDIAVVFVEHKNREVKVSWRANTGFNVASVAAMFGGGGHAAAAGANLTETTLADARALVLARTSAALREWKQASSQQSAGSRSS
jgi:phosphoesterase RecJ-like protein